MSGRATRDTPGNPHRTVLHLQELFASHHRSLAQTGEGIKECELVQWFVSEGDTIEAFDRLCEIQSDKATLEITSSLSGGWYRGCLLRAGWHI